MIKISVIKKLKLIPVLKERKRYVSFEMPEAKELAEAQSIIQNSFAKMFGSYGLGCAGLQFLPDWEGCRGIARINNKYLNHLRASFVLGDRFARSLDVSGTVGKARERVFGKAYLIKTNLARRKEGGYKNATITRI